MSVLFTVSCIYEIRTRFELRLSSHLYFKPAVWRHNLSEYGMRGMYPIHIETP
jgi:hypothetical protein